MIYDTFRCESCLAHQEGDYSRVYSAGKSLIDLPTTILNAGAMHTNIEILPQTVLITNQAISSPVFAVLLSSSFLYPSLG